MKSDSPYVFFLPDVDQLCINTIRFLSIDANFSGAERQSRLAKITALEREVH